MAETETCPVADRHVFGIALIGDFALVLRFLSCPHMRDGPREVVCSECFLEVSFIPVISSEENRWEMQA